jgi:hypothetical protein
MYKIKQVNKSLDSRHCSVAKYQNDIDKLHFEFKPIRDINHMISNNTKMWLNFFKSFYKIYIRTT